MRDDDIDPERLARVLGGEGTAADTEAVRQWAAASPAHARELELLQSGIRPLGRKVARPWRVAEMWTAVERTTQPPRGGSEYREARFSRSWPRGVGGNATRPLARLPAVGARAARPLSAIAAMIVVVLGVSLTVRSVSHHAASTTRGGEYVTMAGQRLSVTLVDGTQLTLAPASRLWLAADYGRGTAGRDVDLEGEAYFAVAHDTAHPFAVRAHGAVAHDVGTAFDVRAYPEDAGVRVTVTDGRVSITRRGGLLAARDAEGGTGLEAGDVATVGQSGVAVAHGVDVKSLTEWTDGRLVFDAAPLREVLATLARWYDLDVHLADSALAARRVTTTVVAGQPIDNALHELSGALGLQCARSGRVVTVTERDNR